MNLIRGINQRKFILIIFILVFSIFILYIFNISAYDLWAPDEPRYAEVAREMLKEGNWIIPHLNKQIYYEKPPLFFAIIAGISALFGEINVFTVRLPVIILAVILIGWLIFFVEKRQDKITAILSGTIMASTGLFFWMAMRVNLDLPMIFCTTGAGFLFYDEIETKSETSWRSYLSFALMGVGSLIKSPIALLPLVIIIIYAWLSGKFNSLRVIPWLKGVLLYLIVVGSWIFLAYNVAGYQYFKTTVLDQIIGYSTGSQGHPRPIYYYLINFPLEALPWSPFLIPAFYYCGRVKKKLPPLVRYSVIWFLSIFIIFSLIGSKRGLYLLQLYPAMAVFLGWFFKEHLQGEIKSFTGLKISNLILGILFIIIGIIFYTHGVDLVKETIDFSLVNYPRFATLIQSMSWFFIIIGIVLEVSIFQRKKIIFLLTGLLFSFGLILFLKVQVMPVVNQINSERFLAQDLAKLYKEEQSVGLYGSRNNDIGFVFYNGIYFDKIFTSQLSVKKFLMGGEVLLVVSDSEEFKRNFSNLLKPEWFVKEYQVGSDKMLLIKTEEKKSITD